MMKNKLCLGTVQFGLDYGINNSSGKPLKKDVFAMLDYAVKHGVEYIDTAVAYGNAEELLGEYGIGQIKDINVISKLKPNLITDNCGNPEEMVETEIRDSLSRLGLTILDGYLLHTPENFYNPRIIMGLQQCKEKGLIKHFGVSIYETEHALDVVKSGLVDYIQIPYSVFDQRLDKTNFFEVARQNKVTVFARSAFLQGLILMTEENIPTHLGEAKAYLREFDQIIEKYGFTRTQAAFLFTYTHPDIDYLVYGVDSILQLQENIEILNKVVEFQACRFELGKHFQSLSKNIIFPSLWSKK